jgi:CysZ protein
LSVSALFRSVLTTLPLMALAIILNLLALPVSALAPKINFFVFRGRNGYLFGHEYFEVVALRRLNRTATRAARQCAARRMLPGGGVIATAFMVHLFVGLRHAEPHLLAS